MSLNHNNARWANVAAEVKRRDGYRCTKCGRVGGLEAHHHDRDPKRFYDPAACSTLCRGCHIREHRGDRRVTTDPAKLAWADAVTELREISK